MNGDELLVVDPVCGVLQEYLRTQEVEARFHLLEDLTARIAQEAVADVVSLANRPAEYYMTTRTAGSRMGIRGVRWILEDTNLWRAVVRGILAAKPDASLLLPFVNWPEEVTAARALFDKGLRIGAGIGTARGALNVDAIRAVADFIEYDRHELTSTSLALSIDDVPEFPEDSPVVDELMTLRSTPMEKARLWVPETRHKPTLREKGEPMAAGLGVSPGAGVGRVALSVVKADEYRLAGEPYILVVPEVYGDEAAAVRSARGLITARGGSTSHAAMVATNSEVPCVISGGDRFTEGDWLSIDGSSGRIFAGRLEVIQEAHPRLTRMLRKADEARRLEIRANADTPDEARRALELGAASIGLVRTEHMFFGEERLDALRALILKKEGPERMEELQRTDFIAWFEAVGHVPIAFRLLDAPLHEFLPQEMERPVDSLMGVRGLRLSAVRPEIEAAQLRALAGAYRKVNPKAPLHILFPMVSAAETEAAVKRVRAITGDLPLEFGATIETPGGALEAGRIATHVHSFAWGTNDLTQFTLGIGRNIAPQLLPVLKSAGIRRNPLDTIDPLGTAQLIRIGEERGRAANPKLVTGICGKHATDPDSVLIAHRLGLDYISVPAGQVERARITAGEAAGA